MYNLLIPIFAFKAHLHVRFQWPISHQPYAFFWIDLFFKDCTSLMKNRTHV